MADLAAVGMPNRRAAAVTAFAAEVAQGNIELDIGGDLDDLVGALRALPGIGDWTAQYVAMRGCGQRDAFPATDLGLRRALGADPGARAERWRPWRAYAALHLWTAEPAFSQVRPDFPA
jgi:AraC family transcriptional regulator of adaptative response / DNA-3-methyladenine glycosylase II